MIARDSDIMTYNHPDDDDLIGDAEENTTDPPLSGPWLVVQAHLWHAASMALGMLLDLGCGVVRGVGEARDAFLTLGLVLILASIWFARRALRRAHRQGLLFLCDSVQRQRRRRAEAFASPCANVPKP